MLRLFIVLLLQQGLCDIICDAIGHSQKPVRIYWNIPTFQCRSHKINFTDLVEKFDIIHNENDDFQGEEIAIMYDPGKFPALIADGAELVLRNGGVPQAGNLNLHLKLFNETIEQLIPNANFTGIGIIDFEMWRPIYRQNFGTLVAYKNLSIKNERRFHPLWPNFLLEKEAIRKFEFYARQFMEETLFVAKAARPLARWGYYAYPHCFNSNTNKCASETTKENDRIDWLFNLSDNLHPSLYLNQPQLTFKEQVNMIEGRIREAHRIAGYVKAVNPTLEIVPYFWYKYHNGKEFVSKQHIFNVFSALAVSDIDGLVIWGSSNDVNTKMKCINLYNYVNDVLGPALVHNF